MSTVQILGVRSGHTLPPLIPAIAAAREQKRPVLVLVPEQYTLQAERELIRALGVPGLMDLDVLSPRRLGQLVREMAGQPPLPPLNARGRAMVLSRILLTEQDRLPFYGRSAATAGLPDRLCAVIRDLEQSGRDPDWLRQRADAAPSALTRAKLTDLAHIWQQYRTAVGDRFLDEDALERETVARLPLSGLARGKAVFVCGFDAVSSAFGDLLATLAAEADSACMAFTLCPPGDPDSRAFRGQRRAVDSLRFLLRQRGLDAAVSWSSGSREAAPELEHLERQLFSLKPVPWTDPCPALRLHTAANPYDEALFAARQLRLWHEAGIPWARMSLALADPGRLENPLSAILSAAEIPHYLARKDSAARHGLCRMLLGALRAVCTGYEQKQVFRCLDSGFSPLGEEDALALRSYALANGIRWRRWTEPFTRGEDAAAMEPLRSALMAPVTQLRFDLEKAADGAGAAEALWRFLEAVGAYDRLLEREEALLARGLQTEAAQNRQVWQIMLDLLDQMHTLLAGEKCGLRHLAQLVESGLAGASVSALPPAPDAVMVGEAGHLLTGDVDALILMGMQDGVTVSAAQDLLTDPERGLLSEGERPPVGMDSDLRNALRRADFYRTLTTPTRFLILTCSASGVDGTGLPPATLLADLRRLFPRLAVTGGVTAHSDDLPLSPRLALEELPQRLREGPLSPLWREAWTRLSRTPAWQKDAQALRDALGERVEAAPLPPETARVLYQQEETTISRLETFAACPFQHFVTYGLRPAAPRRFEVQAADLGDFYHQVLCRYIRLATQAPDWPHLTPETEDGLIREALSPAVEAWADGPLAEDAVSRALGESYVRTVTQTARMLTRHARSGKFSSFSAEVGFGTPGGLPPVILQLANGRTVALRGVIDRIDRWQGDKGLCLRVVDNKKSAHSLSALKMLWGLQLQLVLYLDAASRGEEALPAGAFYFEVQDPLVTSDSDVRAAVEKELARMFRLSGVTLADVTVVEAMNASGSITRQWVKKDGGITGGLSADLAGMEHLMASLRETAAALCLRLQEGEIDISPAQLGGEDSPCAWCACSGVCGLDPRLPGGDPRQLDADMTEEEAWALLTGAGPEETP